MGPGIHFLPILLIDKRDGDKSGSGESVGIVRDDRLVRCSEHDELKSQ